MEFDEQLRFLISGIGESEGKLMSMKERLEVHRKIVAENKRKEQEWKGGKAA